MRRQQARPRKLNVIQSTFLIGTIGHDRKIGRPLSIHKIRRCTAAIRKDAHLKTHGFSELAQAMHERRRARDRDAEAEDLLERSQHGPRKAENLQEAQESRNDARQMRVKLHQQLVKSARQKRRNR